MSSDSDITASIPLAIVDEPPSLSNKDGEVKILEVKDISNICVIAEKEAWLLLSDNNVSEVSLSLKCNDEIHRVEQFLANGPLILFKVPNLGSEEQDVELRIQAENAKGTVSLRYRAQAANHISLSSQSLFDYAANGKVQDLLKPCTGLFFELDHKGNSVLHIAAENQQSSCTRTFLVAASSGLSVEEKHRLVNLQNHRGQTALHCAIRADDADSVHYLLSHGASLAFVDNDGNLPFHYLCHIFNEGIYEKVIYAGSEIWSKLATYNNDGMTPLILAVKDANFELAGMLIEGGASPNVPDKNGRTPLLHAILINDVEMVKLLLKNGADPDYEDPFGETALMLAHKESCEPMIGVLLDYGASPFIKNSKNLSFYDIADEKMKVFIDNGGGNKKASIKNAFGAKSDDENNCEIPNDISVSSEDDAPPLAGPSRGPSVFASSYKRKSRDVNEQKTFDDNISALNYLSRLRLAHVLDKSWKWHGLAVELGCEQMIEFIEICSDEEASPTLLLFDQIELLPDIKISDLRNALDRLGFHDCVEVLDKRAEASFS